MPSLPPMNDPRAIHRFFLNQIQQGETALTYGFTNEAVQHFAYAIVVCSQPTQLLQVLQQTLSPGVFKQLLATIPSVRQVISRSLLLIHFSLLRECAIRPEFRQLRRI